MIDKRFDNVPEFTEWLKKSPGSKTIKLRNVLKITALTVEPAKDPNGNWLGGVKEPQFISREEKESGKYFAVPGVKRRIEEGTVFDLDNPKDAIDWEWVQYADEIVLTKEDALNDKRALFYVDMPEYEAIQKVSLFQLKKKAFDLIDSTPDSELVHVMGLLGVTNATYMTSVQIKDYLYTLADKDRNGAEKVIDTLEDDDYHIMVLLLEAKKKDVVRKIDGVYRYGDIVLGFTEGQVKEFLKNRSKNKDIIDSIMKETHVGSTTEKETTTEKKPTRRKSTRKTANAK